MKIRRVGCNHTFFPLTPALSLEERRNFITRRKDYRCWPYPAPDWLRLQLFTTFFARRDFCGEHWAECFAIGIDEE